MKNIEIFRNSTSNFRFKSLYNMHSFFLHKKLLLNCVRHRGVMRTFIMKRSYQFHDVVDILLLSRSMSQNHNILACVCRTCHDIAVFEAAVERHIKTFHPVVRYEVTVPNICIQCGKRYHSTRLFRNHVFKYHGNSGVRTLKGRFHVKV